MFCHFWQKFENSKWPPFLGRGKFLPKIAKQNCFYLLNRADRAISSKFSTHRVSKECNICNFQKIFPSPKMAAILNFRIFAKNGKTQICFYLLNRASRAISSKFSIRTVKEYLSKFAILQFWQKFSKIPKNGGHFWEFSKFFCQKLQNYKFA